jgi:ubiquinone biosynthesis O-methyltransferase
MKNKLIFVAVLPILALVILHNAPFPRNDLSIYDRADWWNPNSSFAILEKMNRVRVPYFVSKIRLVTTNDRSNLSIVDLGCGGGLVTENIAKNFANAKIIGYDMSEKSISIAREHGKKIPNLSYQVASIYDLPISNASVDVVIVSDVFEHLENLPRALDEISRVLKPGGLLVFDTIARTWWSFLTTYLVAQEVLGIVERGAHDFHLFINPIELDTLLVSHGFETNPKQWEGIVAKLNFISPIKTGKLSDIIETFFSSNFDLSSSYMGYAVKKTTTSN